MMTRTVVGMVVGVSVGACAPTTISPNWGVAYQNMRAQQVLNPAAGEQLDPVEGQDGKVSATAMEAYRKNFEKPDAEFTRSAVASGVQTK
ncbi:MAG: hypothetical protein OZ918_06400 [Nitrospirales bacterium]|nr:hypothetical protein [Nitrospira sp.]MEB2338236.1 hypothetical protein [Nitrospirales bacterium]QOJ35188.1 MAG: hypothetical protein HRU82_09605 [Nitrospira sp.]